MEVAEQGRITAMTPPAHLIERCDCPAGYSGLSCEVSWLQLTFLSPIQPAKWKYSQDHLYCNQFYFKAYPQPILSDLPLTIWDAVRRPWCHCSLEVGITTQGKYLIKMKRFVKIWNSQEIRMFSKGPFLVADLFSWHLFWTETFKLQWLWDKIILGFERLFLYRTWQNLGNKYQTVPFNIGFSEGHKLFQQCHCHSVIIFLKLHFLLSRIFLWLSSELVNFLDLYFVEPI